MSYFVAGYRLKKERMPHIDFESKAGYYKGDDTTPNIPDGLIVVESEVTVSDNDTFVKNVTINGKNAIPPPKLIEDFKDYLPTPRATPYEFIKAGMPLLKTKRYRILIPDLVKIMPRKIKLKIHTPKGVFKDVIKKIEKRAVPFRGK